MSIPDPLDPVDADGKYRLLLTESFVAELAGALDGARTRIALQAMTFDGDQSGLAVASHLRSAAERGVQVDVVVDSFAFHVVSDTAAWRPEVRAEAAATRRMFDELRRGGARVVVTNPYGPLGLFSIARNHKKALVVDEVAYLGGINISDHNFAWHDVMVRTDDPAVVAEVWADIQSTVAGQRLDRDGSVLTNAALERRFDHLIAAARDEVIVASPYALDLALLRRLKKSKAPRKTIITAMDNNLWIYRRMWPYLSAKAAAEGISLRTYGRFSHGKFALFDDRHLLVGSTNFDHHSLRANQEIALEIDDPSFIARFRAEMVTSTAPVNVPAADQLRRASGAALAWGLQAATDVASSTVVPRVPTIAGR